MNMLHKVRIALAVTLMALATVSAVDSASASLGNKFIYNRSLFWDSGP